MVLLAWLKGRPCSGDSLTQLDAVVVAGGVGWYISTVMHVVLIVFMEF